MKQDPLHELLATIQKLRSKNGSPWHQSQDHHSLRRFLLEECHETLEILDQDPTSEEDYSRLKDELSDVLFQILLHSEISKEKKHFEFSEVLTHLNEKIKRRHSRTFAGEPSDHQSIEDDLHQWKNNKSKESSATSKLDGLPDSLPSLSKAQKIIDRVSHLGFQWSNLKGPLEKLEEEIQELKRELQPFDSLAVPIHGDKISSKARKKIEAEIGDCIFCLTNIAHLVDLNAEDALRTMLHRFSNRFRYMENAAREDQMIFENLTLEEMDRYWDRAKQQEKKDSV